MIERRTVKNCLSTGCFETGEAAERRKRSFGEEGMCSNYQGYCNLKYTSGLTCNKCTTQSLIKAMTDRLRNLQIAATATDGNTAYESVRGSSDLYHNYMNDRSQRPVLQFL